MGELVGMSETDQMKWIIKVREWRKKHWRVDLIEHQLAPAVRDTNGRAYNRTKFTEERTIMMQQWADYLESIAGIPAVTAL